jgi:prevent-host-death family protein
MSRSIKVSEFRRKCCAILDSVARTRDEVVITKHGKPIARLLPHSGARRKEGRPKAQGLLKDRLFITGDIISPIDVEWDAMK